MKVPSIGTFSSSLNPSSAVDNPASPTSASSDENNLDDFSRESSIIENIDQFEYSSLLEEANSSSYPDLENSHCVQLGYDPSSSHPIILLIPELGLNKIQPMTLQLHRLVLYFLKMIQHIVIHRYILIYCHTPLSILSQTTLIQQFHKILPTSHRKNISKLIVLHPTFMIKLFFDTAGSWFLSKKFYRKLVFYETIRDFQLHNPSFQIQFPSTFHRNEDHNLGYKPASYLPPLQRFFVKSLGTTKLLYRCIEYLRKINGSQSKGLFRIAGDRVIEDLVKTRLCLMPNDWEDYIIIGDKEVKGSPLIIESSPTMPNSIPIHQRASSQSLSTVPTPIPPSHQRSISLPQIPSSTQSPLSCLHITDIDCICGILKMSIRDLPEPLISYGHYDYLTDLTRRLESGQLDRTSWEEQVNRAIGTLPYENNATLKYLLGFLAEVAAASLQNSMDPDNLGRVFAPTLFRAPPSSKDVDPLIAFQEVNLQKNVIKFLISQQMNHDGGLSISSFQFNNRMMSRIQRGNDDESGEEVDLPVKSDHHSQTREDISLQEQLLDGRNGDGDHWNDDVLAESGIDERCCIVSYDLREELGMHSLHDHTRDDIMATAHQQLRQFRLEQNSLPNSDSPNDDLQPPVSPLVPLNDHVSSIPGDESKQQNLVEELRERSESTERYSTSLPRDQLLNDAREQVRQFLLERERDTKEEEVSVPLSTSNDLEIKEAESPDSSL